MRRRLIKINGQCLPINNQLLPPDAPKALLAEVLPPRGSRSSRRPAS
jgi:hypothetical protein